MQRGATPKPVSTAKRRRRGFEAAASLLKQPVRKISETRGFALSTLLTGWDEIAGPNLAPLCRPVKVGYSKTGVGASLTLLTSGPHAPLVDMERETLRQRVNAAYGYNAISRIVIAQTAPGGFSEGAAQFETRKPAQTGAAKDETACALAAQAAAVINDTDLRSAIERLGANILTRKRAVTTGA